MVNDDRNLNWIHRTNIFVFAAIICELNLESELRSGGRLGMVRFWGGVLGVGPYKDRST